MTAVPVIAVAGRSSGPVVAASAALLLPAITVAAAVGGKPNTIFKTAYKFVHVACKPVARLQVASSAVVGQGLVVEPKPVAAVAVA